MQSPVFPGGHCLVVGASRGLLVGHFGPQRLALATSQLPVSPVTPHQLFLVQTFTMAGDFLWGDLFPESVVLPLGAAVWRVSLVSYYLWV